MKIAAREVYGFVHPQVGQHHFILASILIVIEEWLLLTAICIPAAHRRFRDKVLVRQY